MLICGSNLYACAASALYYYPSNVLVSPLHRVSFVFSFMQLETKLFSSFWNNKLAYLLTYSLCQMYCSVYARSTLPVPQYNARLR